MFFPVNQAGEQRISWAGEAQDQRRRTWGSFWGGGQGVVVRGQLWCAGVGFVFGIRETCVQIAPMPFARI